jgi:hypothetical protein
MSSIFVACMLLLSAPLNFSHTIFHTQNLEEGNTYVRPLSYEGDVNGPITYEELRYQAIFNCKNAKGDKVDVEIIDKIIEVEKQYNVPHKLRGMLLSAACSESGYNPQALGDWRTVRRRGKNRRVAKAVGLFQMWPWWTAAHRGYGIDRCNVEQSGHAFMKHIMKQLGKNKCKSRDDYRRWVIAWVTAIRAPKPGGRCKESPNHLRVLKRWHKNIKKERDDFASGC